MNITDHKVNGLNESIDIEVADAPGSGGANHRYILRLRDFSPKAPQSAYLLKFQEGPIQEVGVNGISNEALMAVVLDRLRAFQNGPFSCRENSIALTHLETSLMWLQNRTRARMARGVEGTLQK